MPPKKKPKTKEEIKEQKQTAERLRYQRLKNYPEKREQLKVKERRNYQIKKEKDIKKRWVKSYRAVAEIPGDIYSRWLQPALPEILFKRIAAR
ncbi:unnamed protein product [Leptosia nina]|uniref:Uncharacterized protein n=1 Tax=Leptosia nina TaxID=320188 RepID=A0AAV1JY67_9NEOP